MTQGVAGDLPRLSERREEGGRGVGACLWHANCGMRPAWQHKSTVPGTVCGLRTCGLSTVLGTVCGLTPFYRVHENLIVCPSAWCAKL